MEQWPNKLADAGEGVTADPPLRQVRLSWLLISALLHTALCYGILFFALRSPSEPESAEAMFVEIIEYLPPALLPSTAGTIGMVPDGGTSESSNIQPSPVPDRKITNEQTRKNQARSALRLSPKSEPRHIPNLVNNPVRTENIDKSTGINDIASVTSPDNPTTMGPAGGASGVDLATARSSYSELLISRLIKFKEYPAAARKRNLEGKVMVRLILNRDGSLQDYGIEGSSGFEILDESATMIVKRANPYPEVPSVLSGSKFEFFLPIIFRLN